MHFWGLSHKFYINCFFHTLISDSKLILFWSSGRRGRDSDCWNVFHFLAHYCYSSYNSSLRVSTKGTEIILFEGALLVLPTEVWVAEVNTGGNWPEQKFKLFNLFRNTFWSEDFCEIYFLSWNFFERKQIFCEFLTLRVWLAPY